MRAKINKNFLHLVNCVFFECVFEHAAIAPYLETGHTINRNWDFIRLWRNIFFSVCDRTASKCCQILSKGSQRRASMGAVLSNFYFYFYGNTLYLLHKHHQSSALFNDLKHQNMPFCAYFSGFGHLCMIFIMIGFNFCITERCTSLRDMFEEILTIKVWERKEERIWRREKSPRISSSWPLNP